MAQEKDPCKGYYLVRDEDFVVAEALESKRKMLLLGVPGSGVSSLVRRATKLSQSNVLLVHDADRALEQCEKTYVVVDTDNSRVGDLLQSCRRILVAATAPLDYIATQGARLARSYDVVVLKPLDPSQVKELLLRIGVPSVSDSLLEKVYISSGGMPGKVCENAEKLAGRGGTIDLSLPDWLVEASKTMGSLFGELMKQVLLGVLNEDIAAGLGLSLNHPWLFKVGSNEWRVWSELLWLQPFAIHVLGHEAAKVLEAGLSSSLPGYVKYHLAVSLYKIRLEKPLLKKIAEYAEEAYSSTLIPYVRHSIALNAYKALVEVNEYAAALNWLSRAIENLQEPPASKQVSSVVIDAKLLLEKAGAKALPEYLRVLYVLAKMLSTLRMFEELRIVEEELEDLLWNRRYDDYRGVIEAYYLLVDAVKSMSLGDWINAERATRELVGYLHRLDESIGKDVCLIQMLVKGLLRDLQGYNTVLGKCNTLLNSDDNLFIEAYKAFMFSSPRELREKMAWFREKSSMDGRIALLYAVLEASLYGRVPAGFTSTSSPAVKSIVLLLSLLSKGRVAEAVNTYNMYKVGEGYTELDFIVDLLINISYGLKARDVSREIRETASRLEDRGNRILASMLRDAANAIDKRDLDQIRLTMARIAVYSIYTLL